MNWAITIALIQTNVSRSNVAEELLTLPPTENIERFGCHFQKALVPAVSRATYANSPVVPLAGQNETKGDDMYNKQFRAHWRQGINGHMNDIHDDTACCPIAITLHYADLHGCVDANDFQLRRDACRAKPPMIPHMLLKGNLVSIHATLYEATHESKGPWSSMAMKIMYKEHEP